jgi:hypothetical protein
MLVQTNGQEPEMIFTVTQSELLQLEISEPTVSRYLGRGDMRTTPIPTMTGCSGSVVVELRE